MKANETGFLQSHDALFSSKAANVCLYELLIDSSTGFFRRIQFDIERMF